VHTGDETRATFSTSIAEFLSVFYFTRREREAVWPQNEERRKKCNYSFVYVHIAEKRRGERKT